MGTNFGSGAPFGHIFAARTSIRSNRPGETQQRPALRSATKEPFPHIFREVVERENPVAAQYASTRISRFRRT